MSVLASSRKKTKLIKQISKVQRKLSNIDVGNPKRNALRAEEDRLYHEFWECLHEFPVIVDVIDEYNYTEEEMKQDSSRIMFTGISRDGWYQGEYLPLSLLAFAPPLAYYLENKDQAEGREEYYNLVMQTLTILKAM